MNCARRSWIHRVLASLSMGFLFQRSADARGNAAPACSGTVTDARGGGISNLIVEVVEPSGRVATGQTDGAGKYTLPAPASGPYVIVFRESKGKTRLLEVRQLTARIDQSLSVTIDLSMTTFLGLYSPLQAIETLTALMANDPSHNVAQALFRHVPFGEMREAIAQVQGRLDQERLTDQQRRYLRAKWETVNTLLGMMG